MIDPIESSTWILKLLLLEVPAPTELPPTLELRPPTLALRAPTPPTLPMVGGGAGEGEGGGDLAPPTEEPAV